MKISDIEIIYNLYFVSPDFKEYIILEPRIPNNFLTFNDYENNTIDRVCMSTSINGCLKALSRNLDEEVLYVYVPIDLSKIYMPDTDYVPDVDLTDEVWSLEETELRVKYKIKVHDNGKKGEKYKYGNKVGELYSWDYEILKTYF